MPAGPHKRTRPRALKLAIASPLPGATYLDPMLPADHAMTAPLPPVPIPANDAQRVDAVRRLEVLDTEAEAEFDDIAWLAAHVTGAPMALVSLLDANRQWFKARCGTDLEGTPRSVSFCSHTVMGTELMEVPDAEADPRFVNNPLVTNAPGVRSYAGVPLIGREGYAYGTLCTLSTRSRVLDDQQKQALIRLARQAVSQLEARRDRLAAQAQRKTLSMLLEAMPDGVVACGTDGLLREFNHAARQWHGADPRVLPPAQWAQHFDLYTADGNTLLPTDAIPLLRAWRGEHVRNAELVIRANGQPARSVLCNADPVVGDKGTALGAVCVMHDITQLKDASAALSAERARLQALVDASQDVAIIAFDPQGRIELFNPGAEQLLGYTAEEVLGSGPARFHLQAELERHMATLALSPPSYVKLAAAAAGDMLREELWTLVRKDGELRRVRLCFNIIHDAQQGLAGYLAMAIDVTAELQAQAAAQLAAERFAGAFETAPQGMAIVSLEGAWRDVNPSLCSILGYPREQLLRTTFQQITYPEDLDMDLKLVQELIDGKRDSYSLAKRYISQQGAVIWAQLSVSLVRDGSGAPVHFVSQIQDVTERHVAAERLAESEARLRAISDATPALVSQFDASQRCLFANEAHRDWLGVEPASLVGMPITHLLGAALSVPARTALAQVAAGQRASFEHVLRIGSTPRDVEITLVPETRRSRAGMQGFFLMAQDVTAHKTLHRLMHERATRDALTGLPNRHAWTEALQAAVVQAKQLQRTVAVMFLDLDGFKRINDTYGHRAGDAVLVEFGHCLQRAVEGRYLVARLAGDEFVVLLDNLQTPEAGCATVAKRIRHAAAAGAMFGEQRLPIQPSIGVAWQRGEQADAASLMHAADEAMYAAKNSPGKTDATTNGRVSTR
ncbi:PAS domain S-box protein [Xanthomonas phaseoli pv. phaseoli]|nr:MULTISPECIES: PAS domain S-box protein [Xanthomonas]ATS24067.2 PAS domain S-box protein [Xanthomonas phaseoli pv. phaseoli]ATS28283.2 PAS domain S-box protein [Xanthomonas phaseoli pv. phaseoli]ATS32180.2 PAS domain S-box protein [Xanthomonas phaseoli pv. phaseoli]ATS36474.2 PAS domain S-box protein [Xanthomonas phaseoli pv. phaseoli]MBO9736211.1 PAS domain S-box protein [Xanthomonas phaseoli pv. phaseoli]